jgi:fatty-acyl-CoA synthase
MPKGVLWRQHDIFMSAMGGRPFTGGPELNTYQDLIDQVVAGAGLRSFLVLPPLMHGAAQWGVFNTISAGGWVAVPEDVKHFDADAILRLAERERVLSIPVVGDAMARPLVDQIEKGDYDLSGLMALTNGGAPLSPTVRERLLTALPNLIIMDAVGASESGAQMTSIATKGADVQAATFTPMADTTVVAVDFSRVLEPGDGEGWLARRVFVPLGYLGDADKTARTFPTIDGVRFSIPGDKARYLADGRIELLGRDSVTINSGGEKIFAEEVERAIASHPSVYDVVVAGRPSERWGNEVVAIVQLAQGKTATDEELIEACRPHIAQYKFPKAFVRTDQVVRSPAGKADYRWAKALAAGTLGD